MLCTIVLLNQICMVLYNTIQLERNNFKEILTLVKFVDKCTLYGHCEFNGMVLIPLLLLK